VESEEKPGTLFTTRIRNAMLALLTTKTSEDVLTVEGKAKLRKELLRAARAASEEPKVEAIYITEFIVQL
jgi:flagellar FliL protein